MIRKSRGVVDEQCTRDAHCIVVNAPLVNMSANCIELSKLIRANEPLQVDTVNS